MADGVRRLTFSTPGFFKNLVSKTTQNGQSNDELSRRTLSDPGAGYIPSYNQSIQQDLDNLVSEDCGNLSSPEIEQQNGLGTNTSFLRLNRSHWKDKSKFNHCHRCAKPFGFAERKYNCRRCGEVFCEKCCQYRKRLDANCQPDPQGNIHRVCYNCSDLHTQALGECKSLTENFMEFRKNKRIVISEELDRLVTGFADNVRPDQRLKNFADSLLGLKVPEWQKTQKWLESQEVEWCTKCQSKFTIFNVKHHCRVCGSVFCRYCCKNDLLLYYDESGCSTARLINVVGCPDKEPNPCCYLPVCILCHGELEEYQVQQFHLILNEVDGDEGNIGHVSLILDRLRHVERKLETTLPRFQEKVEAYLYEQQYETVAGESKVTDFAKLQGDISDLFSKYTAIIQGLKQYQLSSPTEIRIMKNIVHVKCTVYNDQMNLFKKLKATLNKSLPARDLEQLLEYTNTQAINNTYITARQLGFEALSLAEKYGFETEIAERLSEIDAICFEELKKFVASTGEDWALHHKVLNSLLKDQLTKKKLVSPSQRAIHKQGSEYVRNFLIQRSFTLVYKISTALKAKSSDEKFNQSKEALKILLNDMNEMMKPNCY